MIVVSNLSKRYGAVEALRGVSFELGRGEVLGLLGPNGAGKTTTMRILTCYLAPSGGTATVGGLDIRAQPLRVRHMLGYLAEDTPLYPDMTVLEYLELIADLRRLQHTVRFRRIGEVAELCGLFRVLGRPIGHLSKGFRQRLGLAQALLHDPPILLLDEPTSGLDPNQIAQIRELVREIGSTKTIIVSTHLLPEVQAACSRVLILHDGRLVADGSPAELSAAHDGARFRLLVDAEGANQAQVIDAFASVAGVSQLELLANDPDGVALAVKGDGTTDLRRALFTCVRDKGWIMLELTRQRATIEDVFRHLTQE